MAYYHDAGYSEAKRKIDENFQSKHIKLNLGGLDLIEIPPTLSKLTHLKELKLGASQSRSRKNYLKEIPEFIFNLYNLSK